nr:hypothetical protein [Chlamydiota bacterium]
LQDISQGKDHFDIARILREQSAILGEKREYTAAVEKVKEAIAMQKRVYGSIFSSQSTVAATYRLLGDFLLEEREYQQADKAYEKAGKINQAAYQSDVHPYLARIYQKRANVLRLQGKISLAEVMEKKSQKIKNSNFEK